MTYSNQILLHEVLEQGMVLDIEPLTDVVFCWDANPDAINRICETGCEVKAANKIITV